MATLQERRKPLLTGLDGDYIDDTDEKRVVAIKPKPVYRPIFHGATTKAGSDVVLFREEDPNKPNQPPPDGHGLTAFRVLGGDPGGSKSP